MSNGKTQTELFTITNIYDINTFINILDDIVINYPLPSLKKKEQEIELYKKQQEYELENELLKKELEYAKNQMNLMEEYIKNTNSQMDFMRDILANQINDMKEEKSIGYNQINKMINIKYNENYHMNSNDAFDEFDKKKQKNSDDLSSLTNEEKYTEILEHVKIHGLVKRNTKYEEMYWDLICETMNDKSSDLYQRLHNMNFE